MSESEMTSYCATAMGIETPAYAEAQAYDPLRDDAQAMALLKRFADKIIKTRNNGPSPHAWNWTVYCRTDPKHIETGAGSDINSAIVECVAKMHAKR